MQRKQRKYCDWSEVPLVLTVEEACILLGESVPTLIKQLQNDVIKGRKTGKQWLIPKESVQAYLRL